MPISPMFYLQLLLAQIPKAQKTHSSQQYLFALLESTLVKAARKTLVKSTFIKL